MLKLLLALGLALVVGSRCHAGELSGNTLLTIMIRTGETEVFAVDPDTGDARNLSRSPGSAERYAAWSPDGKAISFTSDRDGAYNLFLMNADGTNVRQLTREKAPTVAGMQSWTPDGKWIYFGRFGRGMAQICRIAPDGTGFQVIGDGIDAAVSRDGRMLVFARQVGKGHCLFVSNADGTDVRQITFKENQWAGVHPNWTPAGKILFGDQVGDALELFQIDPDGANGKQLTFLKQAATSPAVSPDGKWISFRLCDEVYWRDSATSARAYKEKRADKRPVWVMGIDGSNPHVIEPLHYQTTIDGSRAEWKPK